LSAAASGPLPAPIGGYRPIRELGRGAVGVVFEADSEAGPVALKVVEPSPLLGPEEAAALRARFVREARALAAVRHPNVVGIREAGESDGRLYLAMELLVGENLRQVLARQGRLAPADVVAVGRQLCAALEAVHHAGIVHRDVKPENLILQADGGVKLTDFGIAWMQNEATLTRTGGVLGSPAYMAPEQILGKGVDARADLFAACATLYQLLTGELPFPGESLMEMAHNVAYAEPRPLPPDVPPALGQVLLRGLRKSAAARPTGAAELGEALRAALERAPEGSLTATLVDAAARCHRHPARVAAAECADCRRPLCRACARPHRTRRGTAHYCVLHTPVTLFGISTVRLEVALAIAAFLLLLLSLSPLGYGALR
jgi:serine/threonine protein kinase